MPKIKSYLSSNVIVLDLAKNAAAIPGNGNVPVTFSYTFDVAKFLIAALDLDHWPKQMRICGDTITWNEFISLAEEMKGKCLM